MKLRSAQDVMAVAKARGFDIQLRKGPPPMPVLVRPGNVPMNLASEALMNALKAWRKEIMDELARRTEGNGS